MKKRNNQKGFTLVELIVVVAIIAILAAIAVPNFMGLIEKAEVGKDIANATTIAGAVNVYNVLNSDAPRNQASVRGIRTNARGIERLGDLWPSGIDEADVRNATARIIVTDNVATVDRD